MQRFKYDAERFCWVSSPLVILQWDDESEITHKSKPVHNFVTLKVINHVIAVKKVVKLKLEGFASIFMS